MQNSELDHFLLHKTSLHHAESGCSETSGLEQDRLTSAWFTRGVNSDYFSEFIFHILD